MNLKVMDITCWIVGMFLLGTSIGRTDRTLPAAVFILASVIAATARAALSRSDTVARG